MTSRSYTFVDLARPGGATRWLWRDRPLRRLRQLFCQHARTAGTSWRFEPDERGVTRTRHVYWCETCGKRLPLDALPVWVHP